MAITSFSLAFFSTYAQPVAAVKPTESLAKDRPAPVPAADAVPPREGGRRNPLVDALMSALSQMGLSGATAKPSATTPAAAVSQAAVADASTTESTPASASASSQTIEQAVVEFAGALWQALAGHDADPTRSGGDRDHGDREHHLQHQGGMHGRGRGYGALAQRLEGLAAKLSASAPVPAPGAAVATDPAGLGGTVPVVNGASTPSTAVATAPVPAVPAAMTAATNAVATSGARPLIDAFAALWKALRPESTEANKGADMGAKLGEFLHLLAQSLRPASAPAAGSAVGVLINVTA
jgi:hypothetical protein